MARSSSLVFLSSVALALAGCGGGTATSLNGAGATFPYPLYSKWFSDYARATGVRINYQSIGSGGGSGSSPRVPLTSGPRMVR